MRRRAPSPRTFGFAALFAALALAAMSALGFAAPAPPVPHRVLLVGNSLVYTNNLPAILHALIMAQRHAADVRIDMFARGGATLSDDAADPRFRAALRNGRYDTVILQERGGDAICASNAQARDEAECRGMIRAERDLADAVRHAGAAVYFLGTYQPMPQASAALVEGERWLAARMAAHYIEVSQTWKALRQRSPELPWLYADGDSHPGMATTTLMAVRAYTAMFGAVPEAAAICTSGPRLSPHDGSDEVVPFETLIVDAAATTCVMTKEQVAQLLGG